MSVGNGISNKYKFHNSANFLDYFLQQVFLNLSYGGVLNVEETYLPLDIWSRYGCDIKGKAFAAVQNGPNGPEQREEQLVLFTKIDPYVFKSPNTITVL